MAISDALKQRVRARPEEDEDLEDYSASSQSGGDDNDEDGSSSGSDEDVDMQDESEDEEPKGDEDDEEEDEEKSSAGDANEDVRSSLNTISFGALAKAQASLGKRKRADPAQEQKGTNGLDDIRARLREARERKEAERQDGQAKRKRDDADVPSRTSKHAPTVMTSKRAVSRKRTVIEPANNAKARDPRFDPAIRNKSDGAASHYAFLDDYRASEMKALKERMGKTKDPAEKDRLKREITSMRDRQRSYEHKKREQEVMAQHRKRERELMKEGKKSQPYFLKKSDVKKQVLVDKFQNMKSKDRAKALERRRKKVASKEKKEMPWTRRGMEA